MNKIISKFTLIILALIMSAGVFAQQQKNEFYISGSAGFSKLMYKLNAGSNNFDLGGSLGLGYKRFFTEHVGLSIGVEGALYQGRFSANKLTYNEDVYDHIFKQVDYTVKLSGFKERHRYYALSIPLMLHLQTGGKHRIYTALGGKLSFPLSLTSKQSPIDKIVASGHAPLYNVDFTNVPIMGYGTFDKPEATKYKLKDMELKTKLNVLLSAELGVKWQLGKRTYLYTALYADYGLTSISDPVDKGYTKDFLPFAGVSALDDNNVSSPVVVSTVLNSRFDYDEQREAVKFIPNDVIRPLIIGVKVAVAFGGPREKEAPKEDLVLLPLLPIGELADSIEDPQLEPKPMLAEVTPIVILDKDIAKITGLEQQQRPDDGVALVIDNYVINGKELSNYWKKTIDDVILPLKDKGNYSFVLEGNTCTYGSNAINDRLSLDRARVVKAYMVSKGFDASKIEIVGRGKHIPVVPNTSESNRKKNRRVVFIISKDGQHISGTSTSGNVGAVVSPVESGAASESKVVDSFPEIKDENLSRLTEEERALRPECNIALTIDNYENNGKELSNYWKKTIDDVILPLKDKGNYSFVLEGNTCTYGSDAINDRLSLDRARVVKAYMVSKGFDASKIEIVGRGKHISLVPNTSESNRKKNRRVVFIISKDGQHISGTSMSGNVGAVVSPVESGAASESKVVDSFPEIKDENLSRLTEEERALRPECNIALTIDNYENNGKQLSNYWKKTLDDVIVPIRDVEGCYFTLEGHTCSYGSNYINDKLSLDRARLVKAYLVSKGFSAERIKIEGKGKHKPLVPNTSEENRRKNRRVVFIVTKGEM